MTDACTYAWIFLAVSEQPTSLKNILWMADGINHAVPTSKELRASFGWLQAQGLVEKEGKKYLLTKAGAELQKSILPQNKNSNIFELWDAITAKFSLMAEIISQPDNITETEITAANRAYRKCFWEAYRKLKEND